MDHLENEDIWAKWLSGELSEAEREAVKKRPEFADIQQIVAATETVEVPAFDEKAAWENFQALTHEADQDTPVRSLRTWRRPLLGLSAIAAVIALLILVNPFSSSVPQSYSTEIGDHLSLNLPGSSKVTLHALSELRYDSDNWEKERTVNLQGEAFFEVEKGSPFSVITTLGKVRVLGTKFSVKARDQGFKVMCYEGKVAVEVQGETFELERGDAVIVDDKQAAKAYNFEKSPKPAWIDGITQAKNMSMEDLVQELYLIHGLSVQMDVDLSLRYTGPIRHDDAKKSAELICAALGLRCTFVDDRTLIISTPE